MTSGLTKYIRHKRKLHDARKGQPAGTGQLSARVVAEGRSGIRRLFIRDFQIITDGSPAGGGFDLGPAPGELLIGAVAGCLNHGFLIQASLLDIQIDALEVVAEAVSKPGQIGTGSSEPVDLELRYTAKIQSPASDAELEDLRQRVEINSFVYNVVTRGASIAGRLERITA
ncbi:OsmC family protein [Brucella pituitosa]|uniref:OsmC family protein n=1 Tax=Brucella pituitosa TaxID=571256 RepID=UPI0009A1EAE6|nr:OsmC family protein [Brucella pituitosa]